MRGLLMQMMRCSVSGPRCVCVVKSWCAAMPLLFVACCCAGVLAAPQGQQHDLAADLGKAIADIAGRVALEDGYGEEFAAAFRPSGHSLRAGHAPSDAVAFAGADGGAAQRLVMLHSPAETTDAALRSISTLEAAREPKRAAALESYTSALPRLLDAEARETRNIFVAELAPLLAVHARHAGHAPSDAVAFAGAEYDLRALAEQAVAAADAYVEAAGSVPSLSQVASDMDKQDAEVADSLQASANVQKQQLGTDASSAANARTIASVRGSAGAAFLQAAPEVANIRLVEPGSHELKAAAGVRKNLMDALAALETRQASDESLYASLRASSHALTREAAAARKR